MGMFRSRPVTVEAVYVPVRGSVVPAMEWLRARGEFVAEQFPADGGPSYIVVFGPTTQIVLTVHRGEWAVADTVGLSVMDDVTFRERFDSRSRCWACSETAVIEDGGHVRCPRCSRDI